MPDILTIAERRAIAAYDGPISVYPMGASGLPMPWEPGTHWRERKVQEWANRLRGQRLKAAPKAEALPDEDTDATIIRLRGQGLSQRAIATALGLSHVAIHKRLKRIAA